jgi:hypothetical protein
MLINFKNIIKFLSDTGDNLDLSDLLYNLYRCIGIIKLLALLTIGLTFSREPIKYTIF